jgi:hypothetical protein
VLGGWDWELDDGGNTKLGIGYLVYSLDEHREKYQIVEHYRIIGY